MHVSFLSTYPPRACGLATFTRDLRQGLCDARSDFTADVVSVVTEHAGPARRPEAVYELRQHAQGDYAAAAEFLNASSADVVCVQHEFGIFGGPEGTHVLGLMSGVRQPVVTTLHTVLPTPPAHYRRALDAVAARSARLVVMTETAAQILREVYGVDPDRIRVIPHGAPDLSPEPAPGLKASLGFEGRTVALTFGLLGPSKGIEFALAALPRAIEAQPDLLYVVLGATHPEIVRREGERYRNGLIERVEAAGLSAHVRFINAYVDMPELWDYLISADVYVSPYPGMDQICLGTLAYALAAGLPVVSTPYLHAREALADGVGALAPFGDVEAFGKALARFVSGPEARAEAAEKARAFGATTAWPLTGAAYARVFEELLAEAPSADPLPFHPAALGAAMDYLGRLTDDTGPFQHAACGVPDRQHGYCTDDAGRALVVALRCGRRSGDPAASALARTYLSFLHHAQRPDGRFHNFMDYGRRFLDDGSGEDTLGRALWGLGAAVAYGPDAPMRVLARQTFEKALPVQLHHPHALAYSILGMDLYLARFPGAVDVRDRLEEVSRALLEHWDKASRDGWRWFHDAMTYGVGLLPHALLVAYRQLGTERLLTIGREALDVALERTVRDGRFEPVGNDGWFPRDASEPALFDQQPIEAGYLADACATAFALTGEARYAEAARTAVEWFYGRNAVGLPLFDAQTGACYDGLSPQGVNLNQGAESAIACVLGHLALERVRDAQSGDGARGLAPHATQPRPSEGVSRDAPRPTAPGR